jgi:signal peptidase I
MRFLNRIFIILIAALLFSDICYGADTFLPIKSYKIPQNGMYPSLPAGSKFWARKSPFFKMSGIKRGDVVIFRMKKDGKKYDMVWRVIGLPGDNIKIKGTEVFINNKRISHTKEKETKEHIVYKEQNNGSEYLVAYRKEPDKSKRIDIEIKIPNGSFFLLGDNRDSAWDSRYTGLVTFEQIIGKKL